jgi:hypothetical protein
MLASHGIFAEDEQGRFHLTPLAAVLQTTGDNSLRDMFRLRWQDVVWDTYRALPQAIMTGKPAFDHAYGMAFFDYLATHTNINVAFDAAMALFSEPENAIIAQSYDFGQYSRVVDVGGGQGGFLAAILSAYPTVHGVLYDQPQVVAEPTYLHTAGVLERCDLMGGDFFESIPKSGDVYILKRVIHDWDDATSIQILQHCRNAMGPKGRILVIDGVLRPGNIPDPNKNMDIVIMALTSGRERTEKEFHALYQQAGLQLTRVVATPLPSTLSIVEGVCA